MLQTGSVLVDAKDLDDLAVADVLADMVEALCPEPSDGGVVLALAVAKHAHRLGFLATEEDKAAFAAAWDNMLILAVKAVEQAEGIV
jgi:hypothetical protein